MNCMRQGWLQGLRLEGMLPGSEGAAQHIHVGIRMLHERKEMKEEGTEHKHISGADLL